MYSKENNFCHYAAMSRANLHSVILG